MQGCDHRIEVDPVAICIGEAVLVAQGNNGTGENQQGGSCRGRAAYQRANPLRLHCGDLTATLATTAIPDQVMIEQEGADVTFGIGVGQVVAYPAAFAIAAFVGERPPRQPIVYH